MAYITNSMQFAMHFYQILIIIIQSLKTYQQYNNSCPGTHSLQVILNLLAEHEKFFIP